MLKLRRVDLSRIEEILRHIDSYAQEVACHLDPDLVLLFGSFARGDVNEASDVDILVVAEFKEEYLDRIPVLQRFNRWRLPLEPLGLTPKEFGDMKARGNPALLRALEEGKVLYQRKVDRGEEE